MATITLRHVEKVFQGGKRAVDRLSMTIENGEFVVFVGPSGCGKSTLLRMIAGLETVSAGEILIDEEVVNALPPQARNVAMVFQNYALYPHMTVRRNLAFPLKMLGMDKANINQRVAEAARLLDLTDLLERRPKALSGGQRQRVAMGRAIVREPSVFLMDEPLSNLDAKLRVQIRGEIATLQRRLDVTTIYVTHDQVEAMTLGSRVAVLSDGRLHQFCSPRQLYHQPADTFVATFLGNPGMNILPITAAGADAATWYAEAVDQPLTPSVSARGHLKKMAERVGERRVLLGVRPEAIRLAPVDATGLRARVEEVEYLGYETLVYTRLETKSQTPASGAQNRDTVIVRLTTDTQAPLVGEQVNLLFDWEQIYGFDSTGKALT